MRLLTCGSRLEIPSEVIAKFSGVVGGYFWDLWQTPSLQDYAQKYAKTEIWAKFLYGNKHKKPDASSGCTTIEEWVTKRVAKFQYVNHWVLINEFTDDSGNFYPGYEYENIKKWLLAANQANPEAELIIADFRPYQLQKWQKIKDLCDRLLSENIPLHGVGIQCHFKTRNARSPFPGVPYILDALPTVIDMFTGIIPVHLVEVSGWHHYSESIDTLTPLWQEVTAIASQHNVQTFCPWWLVEPWQNGIFDGGKSFPMPTFGEFRGAGIYTPDWQPKLEIFTQAT